MRLEYKGLMLMCRRQANLPKQALVECVVIGTLIWSGTPAAVCCDMLCQCK